jgi:hypothetical protein
LEAYRTNPALGVGLLKGCHSAESVALGAALPEGTVAALASLAGVGNIAIRFRGLRRGKLEKYEDRER